MTLSIERQSLELLASLLLEKAGLKITPDGYYGLRLALQARMPALGINDADEYVTRLKQRAGEQELRSLIPLVTVGKTEFFRDTRQFLAFENSVFPQVLSTARAENRPAKLWSAGCATGEEPYSLSIVALEKGGGPGTVEVLATDLNPAAVESASRAFFPARRLVGVSEERIARHFKTVEGGYELVPQVRELIRLEGHNLAAPVWTQVEARSLDVIFCRNVIIYFDQPTIIGVMERFFEALRPGGWMFLGYSESLFKISTRFEMVEVGGTFAYQRPLNPVRRGPLMGPTLPPRPSAPPPPPPARRSPTDVESVLRKLKKENPLPAPKPSAPPPPPAPGQPKPPPPPTKTPVERLAEVVEAIERGDFPRALRTVHRL
ncbi:MAG TPA: CheR family methyltransferase, partial [Archangium sp.]